MDVKFIMRDLPCFVGVKKGKFDLRQWINLFIMRKTLGGELNELTQEWFGQPLPPLPTL
ncbi:hypothetical protein [Roseinatronobacter monicus]|uniref:hypothetical protein n=1 Tax=Roseinatronobacter monicus TaxID=393481 RepID=UPI001476A54F|nr:hypothetical protein [Roseinatronobacter monicus]